MSSRTHAFSILTMWEETFVRSRRGGTLSAYSATGYALPPVSVVDIISRRLRYVAKQLKDGGEARDLLPDPETAWVTAEFLELVDRSLMRDRKRARYFFESIAMGNLRQAMNIFASFLLSGHTDASKMLSVWRQSEEYTIPLHEFIKSIALGDNRFYQGDLSTVLNVFSISDESRPSHFTKLRLLEYLYHHRARNNASFGTGFVRTSQIAEEFSSFECTDADVGESLQMLATYGLVESDTYDSKLIGNVCRITVSGRYYLKNLAEKFQYLDLVLFDTPLPTRRHSRRSSS